MGSEYTPYVESEPKLLRRTQGKLVHAKLTTFNKIANLTRKGFIKKFPDLEAKELLIIEKQLSVRNLQFRKPRNPKSEAIGMEHGVSVTVLAALWKVDMYTWRDLTAVTRLKFFRELLGASGKHSYRVKKRLIEQLEERGWSFKKVRGASIGDYPFSSVVLVDLESEGICTLTDLKRKYGRRANYFSAGESKIKEIAYVLAMQELYGG